MLSHVNLAGVEEYELKLLQAEAAEEMIERLCLSPPAERASVAELAVELGYLPLGIRLAARAIRATPLSIRDYLNDLRQSKDLYSLDYDAAESGVGKSFGISYSRLSIDLERKLFRCFGIFRRTPITFDAVAYCLGESTAATKRIVGSLIRYGLCDWLPKQAGIALHPLLRRFASRNGGARR